MSIISRLSFGFRAFWSSFSILRQNPKLRRYIFLPVLIDILFLTISSYYLMGVVPKYLMSFYVIETKFLFWLVYGLLSMLSFLSVVLFTFLFANVITAPFNAAMCEKYWNLKFNWKAPNHGAMRFIKTTLYLLVVGLAKSLVLAGIALLAFTLSFFPIFSLLVLFMGLLIIAFDCSDISYEILGFGFRKRFQFFKKYIWEYSGFALAISIISIIPGFNFVFLPFMVLGASHLVYSLNSRGDA